MDQPDHKKKNYEQVFNIEVDGWCYGIANYPGEIYPGLVHLVIREVAPTLKIVIEKGVVYDIVDISRKISQLLTPPGVNAEVEIIYQSIEGLHNACPNNTGDWYFTGNYPTWGGNKVVNRAFIYYMEGKNVRAY